MSIFFQDAALGQYVSPSEPSKVFCCYLMTSFSTGIANISIYITDLEAVQHLGVVLFPSHFLELRAATRQWECSPLPLLCRAVQTLLEPWIASWSAWAARQTGKLSFFLNISSIE